MAKLKSIWQTFTLPPQGNTDRDRRNHMTRVIVGALSVISLPVEIITIIGWYLGKFSIEDAMIGTFIFLQMIVSAILVIYQLEKFSRLVLVLGVLLQGLYYTYKRGLSSEYTLYYIIVILLSFVLLAKRPRNVFLVLLMTAPIVVEFLRDGTNNVISGQIGYTTISFFLAIIIFMNYFTRQLNSALDTSQAYSKQLNHKFEVANRRATESEVLRKAGMYISESLDLKETVNRILDELEEVIPHDSACVLLLRDGGYLEIVGGHGWPDPSVVVGIRFPVPGDNPNTVVVQEGKPYILNNAPEQYPSFKHEPHNHIRSWLGVPLKVNDEVIGMMAIDSKKPDYFSHEQVNIVSSFADHVAVAIDNAQLFNLATQAIQKRTVLYDISQEIISIKTEREMIFQSTFRAVKRLMSCDSFLIATKVDENNLDMEFIISDKGRKNPFGFPVTNGIFHKIIHDGKTILVNDIHEKRIILSEMITQSRDIKSILAVPMKSSGRVIGMMAAQSLEIGAFTPDDRELLELLAAYAAIALDNANLLTEVEKMAMTDSLTSLPNRRAFDTNLEKEISRTKRYDNQLSLLMIDIDDFKVLNDTKGHQAGDEHLQLMSKLISDCLRESDTVYRYGGEEYTVILPQTDLQGGIKLAERIRAYVEQFSPNEGSKPGFTVSIGVAVMPGNAVDSVSLIKAADDAMFAAKRRGKNLVHSAFDA
jgi:diguanylate cyclase (GGDEF)-like protein